MGRTGRLFCWRKSLSKERQQTGHNRNITFPQISPKRNKEASAAGSVPPHCAQNSLNAPRSITSAHDQRFDRCFQGQRRSLKLRDVLYQTTITASSDSTAHFAYTCEREH
ncbi:hypothetical protein PROFUN_09149 [Planoprotostelium fungivorum]|uniref:Uncharacterized protein n=1 Tax=Planoprotostelium fungivorum TaxID=1890364 RepID=A0A2P6MVJ6_9EUKA|nr:hypothetical protein PROFUN_09149 [Planoprotostelium fungivorum]